VSEGECLWPDPNAEGEIRRLPPSNPKPKLLDGIVRHDLVRKASIELVRMLLPTAKGIRLVGVSVSNFDQTSADCANELPLFGVDDPIVDQT
jgi:DNA polymerase IV